MRSSLACYAMELRAYRWICWAFLWLVLLSACQPAVAPPPASTSTTALLPTPTPPAPPTPTGTPMPPPTTTSSPSPAPTVEQLKATVTTGISNGLLSCNYGPGPDYLF